MSGCDLVVLGTSSQRPTRTRNHNGYLLRWQGTGLLFDPGEGTQRQFTLAGASAAKVRHIFLTHLHGDHCLGLPGMLQRMALDGVEGPVPIHFPGSGLEHVERLVAAGIGERVPVELHPVPDDGAEFDLDGLRVTALPLAHRIPALGWRVEEPARAHLLPERLAELAIEGRAAGVLLAEGELQVGERLVRLEEVSEVRPGRSAAVVMDTAVCDNAVELCRGVDLALLEATYLEAEAELADQYRHLTARQAAIIATHARAQLLVLTHFSSRYPDTAGHVREATEVFPFVVAAGDLQIVPFPAAAERP